MHDLSDSREMLEARVPRFVAFFIGFLVIMLLAFASWMWFGQVDEVVRATGVVRPVESISVVRNVIRGSVLGFYVYDGQAVSHGDTLFSINTEAVDQHLANTRLEYEYLITQLALLKRLVASVTANKNLIPHAETIFHNRYLMYQLRYSQLQLSYEQSKSSYEQEQRINSITPRALAALRAEYKVAELLLESFISETLVRLQQELMERQQQIRARENIIKELEEKKRMSVARAPIDGHVQIAHCYNPGDYMPSGVEVLRVIPDSGGNLRVEISVRNEDISQVQLGQKVTYRLLALPYREFGVIEGRVTNISSDAVSTDEAMLTYKVNSVISNSILHNRQGNPGAVRVGMIAESRIVVRRKRLLYFVLEKLDFLS